MTTRVHGIVHRALPDHRGLDSLGPDKMAPFIIKETQ
jgi:hypothetical protein